MEKELREGLEGVRREVGEGVKVIETFNQIDYIGYVISIKVLEKTERLLEGLKSKLINGHGQEEKVVNGFSRVPGGTINGQAEGGGGQNGEGGGGNDERRNTGGFAGGGGGDSETEVRVVGNGVPTPQSPVVSFTPVKPKMEHI